MVTEDFCFPTIANNLAHLNMTTTPSLWRIPSQSEKVAGERHKWRLKSYSELEEKSRRQDKDEAAGGGAEEKMDMLWEDFNEELQQNHETAVLDSLRLPEGFSTSNRAGEEGAAEMCKASGGGPFSLLLVMKMLKKLLMLQNSAALKRHASLP
nr:uncharacterized protein LOC109193861 [Ipomoea batatas]